MQNLIKSRSAGLKKQKTPPPNSPQVSHRKSTSDIESEETAATTTDTTDATARKLNVNASEFVPRTKNNSESKNTNLSELKRHFEALDERKPRLLLPWKGFPKPMRVERPHNAAVGKELKFPKASNETKNAVSLKRVQADKETAELLTRKKQLKDTTETESEKKRDQERKVALEALKLVEQRRMRESIEEKPQVIVHLTRSPVDFTPEERERVNRLRAIKKEHIERVLREMRKDLEVKQSKSLPIQSSGRYVALQRAVKVETKPEADAMAKGQLKGKPEVQSESEKSDKPRRYIPTVKQWDERCKAKANEAAANKENTMARKTQGRFEENAPLQRAMVPSTLGNIIPLAIGSNIVKEKQQQCKDRQLFVPRYWPPAPLVSCVEKRRGNLTHARNISRAFANCGLLPTPTLPGAENPNDFSEQFYELPPIEPKAMKTVKRYGIDELLVLEPQPHELQKPFINEKFCTLGFIND